MNVRLAALLAIFLFSAGCGGKAPVMSGPESAAMRWDQRGHEAVARGDHRAAAEAFGEALAAYRSIEDVDGIAVALMNLAAARQRLGDTENAAAALEEVLVADALPFGDGYRAEAAYRRALFAFENGRTGQVGPWLDRAAEYCAKSACPAVGRMENLRARLALAAGDRVAAFAAARSGLDANRRQADTIEEANSLRLMADAHFAGRDFAAAREHFERALALDKRAGAATKIALDLLGLGRCALEVNDRVAAREFFLRARSVSDGAGDVQGTAEAGALLGSVGP